MYVCVHTVCANESFKTYNMRIILYHRKKSPKSRAVCETLDLCKTTTVLFSSLILHFVHQPESN